MVRTYFINGFMDAGKTSFIKDLCQQDYFDTKEKTLLILCEDGDEEYDEDLYLEKNIHIEKIENEEDFTPDYIISLEKEIRPTRVIVEFNGMWMRKNLELPWYWEQPIEIVIVDATTFELYAKNLKSMVAEQVRQANMVIFNRCDNLLEKLSSYRRNIKAVNSSANTVFKDKDGEINTIFEEDLPYDLSQDLIEITDETFGIFYLDSMENVDRYIGKMVKLSAMVMKGQEKAYHSSIIGRFAMTCCAEDLSLFGFICDFNEDANVDIDDWVEITAIIEKDFAEKYDIYYPVLNVKKYEIIDTPENEIIENI